jgi:hypothetical protein
MKKNLHILIGIIGLAVVGYGLSQPWTGVYLKIADKTMATTGLELMAGQVGIGLAALSLVLLFVKPKFAAITCLLIVACAAFVYLFPKTDKHSAQLGLFLTMGGAAFTAMGTLLAPKRRS